MVQADTAATAPDHVLGEHDLPIAASMGDPAGIGPEILLKAHVARVAGALGLPPFYVTGLPGIFRAARDRLALDLDVEVFPDALSPAERSARTADPATLWIEAIGADEAVEPGAPAPSSASATIAAIETAVAAVRDGRASGVATAPIAKSVLYAAGFAHPGHTEFLGELARRYWPEQPAQPVMMLASSELRVVPVTIHIPLRHVVEDLTTDLIVATGRIVAEALVRDFGLASPRLIVAGLNPHAGEGGALGSEDDAIVAPAVAQLKADGIAVTGPLPADTLFHARARAGYDAVLCMYHDQANIPIKTLAFDEGVNTTIGLPFIRTSPDHGTAFDIAGQGIARADSMVAALRLAGTMAANRKRSDAGQSA